jgi:hypothetical protein
MPVSGIADAPDNARTRHDLEGFVALAEVMERLRTNTSLHVASRIYQLQPVGSQADLQSTGSLRTSRYLEIAHRRNHQFRAKRSISL